MNFSSHRSILDHIDEISDAVNVLWGGSAEAVKLHADLELFRREADEILEKRGMRSLVIAAVGSKNSGKSWLCRTLITDAEWRERIPSGTRRETATEKLIWIGGDFPAQLEHDVEIALPIPSDKMLNLGCSYVLLDVPGHNEADDRRRQIALRSITQASLRVAMFSWDANSDESNDEFLAAGDGATILPLIVDHQHPRPEHESGPEVRRLQQRLQRRCPSSKVLPPVVVPGFEHSANRADAWEHAATVARIAVQQAVISAVDNPAAMLQSRFNALRERLRSVTMPLISRIVQPLENLKKAERKAADDVLNDLVGRREELQRVVRVRMLWSLARSLHPLFFPFRSFIGVLALTVGAIDRVAFAMMGSMPSLAMSAYQAVRNLWSLRKPSASFDNELNIRASNLIAEQLIPARHTFHQAVRHALPSNRNDVLHLNHSFMELSGLQLLRTRSARIFDTCVSSHLLRWPAVLAGALSTLLYVTLIAFPVCAFVQSFVLACSRTFSTIDPSNWHAFTLLDISSLFGMLILPALPVFFLSFIASFFCTGGKRLQKCADEIILMHQVIIREFSEQGLVIFTSRDPVRQAVQKIVSFQDVT